MTPSQTEEFLKAPCFFKSAIGYSSDLDSFFDLESELGTGFTCKNETVENNECLMLKNDMISSISLKFMSIKFSHQIIWFYRTSNGESVNQCRS